MENKTKLIGIVGKKRCGKDTIAEYLINNESFERYSFADPIKRGAMAMFGFTEAQMWGSEKDKETVDQRWGISPRRMLQLLGTELFQFDIQKHLNTGEFPVGRRVWVERFKLWYKDSSQEALSNNKNFNLVVADVRYPHEANAIREMGGLIWRVERPSLSNSDNHSSEIEQESIVPDITIVNDGTLEELHSIVEKHLNNNLQLSK